MKNIFDERYEFRIANINDIDAIMKFIDTNWKNGHILATNKEFFKYEFLEKDGTVNFILAIDKNKNTIEGLNGFLKASHSINNLDIWGSMWMVLDGNIGMLGAEIIKRRRELINCRCDLDVGDNPRTAIPIFKVLLKRFTAKMNHYYILNKMSTYKIANIQHYPNHIRTQKRYNIIRFNNINEINNRFAYDKYIDYTPYKDEWYINHRFFNHPIYEYEIYGIEKDEIVDAIFVLRRQKYEDRSVIRFVDYIGNKELISGIGWFLMDQLKNDYCEYIDFYNYGIDESLIEQAGFVKLEENDSNIIPNYFYPFVQKNIDIWVDSFYKDSIFTKADADQDRPNII